MSSEHQILRNGFTLVELTIIMLIISILSAIVVVQINAREQHLVTTLSDEFRRDLSHAQLLAISQSQRLELTTSSGGYSVRICTTSACTATTSLTDPATGAPFSVPLNDPIFAPVPGTASGVTISPTDTLDFDSLGRPHAGGGGALLTVAKTYTFSGAGRSVTVTVLPLTGFAQAGL